jgi:large subunit ribosomal protein L21
MYAIVEVAGKQYKVKQGLTLHVDKLEAKEGETVVLDKVLLLKTDKDLKIGMPYVEGSSISAVVKTPLFKDKKVIVFHYKNKTGFHKKQGHRHQYTILKIGDIVADKPAKAPKAEKAVETPVVEVAAEAAPKKRTKKTTEA